MPIDKLYKQELEAGYDEEFENFDEYDFYPEEDNWLDYDSYIEYRKTKTGKFFNPDEKEIFYLKNGKLHRTDGPARIWSDGTKEYWVNGQLHRIDGPARIWSDDGSQEYWVNGKEIVK